ncbi:esterase [Alsobacter metallidurans]|uniref:Esterase n=1 Tax=Alsobacter metallidurans TaxID=340221 RepID=A0A917I6H2_9HYPH|nr:alpha/beta fold hydrolase [Alsobacter metallidurans]GGH19591.1 esterase [Alsobacter metallidurans]
MASKRPATGEGAFEGPEHAELPPCAGGLGPLRLKCEGSFFVGMGARTVDAPYYGRTGLAGPGEISVGQMYVHYRCPEVATRPPIVLIHGSNHTGATFETTPDGREGWATLFVRLGHPVYVVDQVGRGRSGFDPTPLNEAIDQRDLSLTHKAPLYARAGAWVNFRFGPRYPEPFPNTQFPLDHLDHYMAQLVPNAEELAAGRSGEATIDALVSLLERVGPAVLITHSQAGLYGLEVARRCRDGVLALVSIEGGCAPIDEATATAMREIPFLSLWGDNSSGAAGANGDARRNDAQNLAFTLAAAGGDATHNVLPDHGVFGNTHMLMMDRNNSDLADFLSAWIVRAT